MKAYDHKKIEKKWQKAWSDGKIYQTKTAAQAQKKGEKPCYVLDMFPYPSGAGLHVGHPRGYIGSDVFARFKRMQGFNVLHPMGYDAFGLPAEQYAIQNKIHPRKAVEKNVLTFEKQLSIIGLSYDWSRKVNTTDPEYYKWTQWIFLKIYDAWYDTAKNKARHIDELVSIFEKKGNTEVSAHADADVLPFTAKEWKAKTPHEQQTVLMKYRLAYEGYSEVNWCPELGTVLANDEIVDGPNGEPVSERGGYPVEKKTMRQWFMRITAYARRLLEDLDIIDWPQHIKEVQRNWIGKSEGSELDFKVSNTDETITVFTTRADTLFGVTYVVLAPEHPLVGTLAEHVSNTAEVEEYVRATKKKDDMMRTSTDKEKTGVPLRGVTAVHPLTGAEVPVWVADYVLPQYGTGAVMAVPAHDERDFAFAQKYNLPTKQVIAPMVVDAKNPPRDGKKNTDRVVIHALVKHPTDDTFISLHWKEFPWKTFITGGVEDGEDIIAAAEREIREETGFKNMRYVKRLPYEVFAQFYAAHKDVNRSIFSHFVYFELKDLDRDEVGEEEKKLHDVVWTKFSDMQTLGPVSELEYVLKWMKEGDHAYTGEGLLLNSGEFDGMQSAYARIKITEKANGRIVTKYKMRDAIFARQRYWGEPIPLSKDKDGMIHSVAEKKLPLELPNVKTYEPTGTGESPLASVPAWNKAGFETNTMPGWAGSSWYFLRYIDPNNKKAFASESELNYWFNKKKAGGVDIYVGGAEHATGHLLYSRFWHKFLFDMGFVPTREPFNTLRNQGMIGAADGRKMSKRWGNVVNPDEVVATYGADTLRLYEMFIAPFNQGAGWNTDGIVGPRRFIERVWKLQERITTTALKEKSYEQILEQTIKKITEDIQDFGFNTAVSQMMMCMNEFEKSQKIALEDYKRFLQVLAPFAPHVTDEIWSELGEKKSIHISGWPKFNPKKLVSDMMTIMIQVNGKIRGEIQVARDESKEKIEALALADTKVQAFLAGQSPKRVIYVPGRLVNIVI